ncbi:response regulator transcription factor [Haloferula sp. BvORR071]|uniref:response regulator n=1 Tax=Haloferula sp. BvORR071 TaxID=1396141 RepID=UPI000554734B|nr:response regulator transcription factor [Haloferula sp. BvORR071]
MSTTRTIALVEDDPVLRETITEVLTASGTWQVTAAYSDAESALAAMKQQHPDVVLMDIQLPGMSGIECVARLKALHPDIQVLMVTVYDNNDRIFDALAAGASGYLLKRDAPTKLLECLEDLLSGGSPMSSAIARKVVQHFQKEPPAKNEDHNLTPREKQILELLVKGGLYKEIAWDLGIGVETVRTHLHNIYAKLHVRTRTEAVVKYLGRQ